MPHAKSQKRRPPQKRDDPEQSRAFIQKAREIAADGNESRADELMGHLARMPHKAHKRDGRKRKAGR